MAEKSRKEEKDSRENVTIFGDDWSEEKWRRRHEDGFTFGAFMIAAGILLLLNTLNIVSWKVWDQVWRFWPLLLMLAGLKILFGSNFASRGLINLLSFILIILVVLFAINQVNPSLLYGLPLVFFQIFDMMKGIQK